MSRNNEFSANLALAKSVRPVARTARPMSRPEREIRETNRLYRLAVFCGACAMLFPVYVFAVMVLVK